MTDITCKLRTSPISTKSHERDALGCRAGDFSRNRKWNQCASHVRRNQEMQLCNGKIAVSKDRTRLGTDAWNNDSIWRILQLGNMSQMARPTSP